MGSNFKYLRPLHAILNIKLFPIISSWLLLLYIETPGLIYYYMLEIIFCSYISDFHITQVFNSLKAFSTLLSPSPPLPLNFFPFLILSASFFHLHNLMRLFKCHELLAQTGPTWISLILAISLGHCTGAYWAFVLELMKLPFILIGVCSPSEANYCTNHFEVF